MSKFHLMHCTLPGRAHGTAGYNEVVETVAWGLAQLGHQVTTAINQPDPNATNIVFGAQILPIDQLQALPKNTIVYNFEQMRNLAAASMRSEIHYVAASFQIWEYNRDNLTAWAALGAGSRVKIIPVGYAPILTRILKLAEPQQDIDVLIYGGIGEKRLNAYNILSNAGLKTVFISGLFGKTRDDFIARSKLILNVNLYDHSRIFEIVRVSYLLANRKAVISILDEGTAVEDDMRNCIRFTTFEKLASDCIFLTDNAAARNIFEEQGFYIFSRRDIRAILAEALK